MRGGAGRESRGCSERFSRIWNHPAEWLVTRPSRGVQISPLAGTSSPGLVVVFRSEEFEEWTYSAEGLAARPSTGHQNLAFLGI